MPYHWCEPILCWWAKYSANTRRFLQMTFQIKLQIWFNWGLAYLSYAMIDYCDDDQNFCTAGPFYTCSVQPSRGGTPTIMVHVNGILPYKDNTCMSFTSTDHLSGLFSEWCHLFILDLFYMPISCCSNKWYCNDDFECKCCHAYWAYHPHLCRLKTTMMPPMPIHISFRLKATGTS
jgi:hypothetical protein